MNKKSKLSDTILAITACLLWSTAFVGVKIVLQYMSPLVFAGIRFLLAAVLILPFCGGIGVLKKTLTKDTKTFLLVGLFQTFFLYGLFFLAMQYVEGAVAAIVIGSSPIISAFVAHILMKDDKMTVRNTLAIMFGTLGIIILSISCKPWVPVGLIEFGGIMLLLVGSFVSAVGNVIVARKKENVHAVALNSSQMGFGGVCLLAVGLMFEGVPDFVLPARFYAALLWLAMLSAVAFSIWFHLLKTIKVSRLNIWKFLIPVFGALFSWILLPSESPSVPAVTGLIFVTVGILTAGAK